MADDVTLNSMSGGAVVATDDSGTGHVQLVKLAYSADGSRTHVGADTDGLKVNVSNATVTVSLGSALPAGSNVIGGVTQSGTWNVTASGTVAATQSGAWTVAATQSGTWDIGSITTLPSLPAGTNAIGKLSANSGVDIGDVDVTSVVPGTSASSLGKADDAAHLSGDTGVMALAVRNDNAALPMVGANADYSPVAVDERGRVFIVDRGATINHASTSVTTTAGSLIGAGTTRRSVTIQNLGTDYVWLGATGITANNGLRLAPGQTATIDKSPNAQIFAIASSGTQTVALFWESD